MKQLLETEKGSDNFGGTGMGLDKLLQTAINLKSYQLHTLRYEFESSPNFMKATEGYARKYNCFTNLTPDEKYQKALKFKIEGNELIKQQMYQKACFKYGECISHFKYFKKMDSKGEAIKLINTLTFNNYIKSINNKLNKESIEFKETIQNNIKFKNYKQKCDKLINECLLNCTLCALKLRKHKDIVWTAKKIFEYDPNNAKTYYRLAESYEILDTTLDIERAFEIIKEGKLKHPNNFAICSKYRILKTKVKNQLKKDKRTFGGLFNRGQLYSDKQKDLILKNKQNRLKQCCNKIFNYMSNISSNCIIL